MCFWLHIYTLLFVNVSENISLQSKVHGTSEDNSDNINSSDTSDNLADRNSGKAYITHYDVDEL